MTHFESRKVREQNPKSDFSKLRNGVIHKIQCYGNVNSLKKIK